jgi:ribosomal protein S18 acetylase RimI-like enzyme
MVDITLTIAEFNPFLDLYTVYKVLRDNNRFNLGCESIKLAVWDNRDSCRFIRINGIMAGGVILTRGFIKHPFIYPGFRDYLPIILESLHNEAIIGVNPEKGISCLPSDSEQAEIFFTLGYSTVRKLRCMIGYLSETRWKCPPGYVLRQPAETDMDLIGRLFYEANINEQWHQPVTPDGFLRGTKRYFDREQVNKVLEASSICVDEQRGEAVGGCLVSIDEAYPFIYDLHILKEHRRKGLATAMMKKAMNMMSSSHKYMRLFVIDGNPAAKLYSKLGFIAGSPVFIMNYKPG